MIEGRGLWEEIEERGLEKVIEGRGLGKVIDGRELEEVREASVQMVSRVCGRKGSEAGRGKVVGKG